MMLLKRYWLWLAGLSLFLLAGLAVAGGWWYQQALLAPRIGSDEPRLVEIAPGASSKQIAAQLEADELIRSAGAFRVHLRLRGISGQLQAGTYRLHSFLPAREIARILTEGETATTMVTILSGLRLDEISAVLVEAGFAPADVEAAFSAGYDHPVLRDMPAGADLEGYLFPDTYEALLAAPAAQLVETMLDNLNSKLTPQIQAGWADQGLSIHQGLTLASIVQKEVADPEQQRLVAQVFLSRLSEDQRLEADPTFRYAAAILGVTPSIDVDSPYNTYRHRGLPPGPIGNSELSALEAVATPAASDYRYFVTGEDGVTRFSRTFEEHQRLIAEHGISRP